MKISSIALFTCVALLSVSTDAKSQKTVKEKCYKADVSATSDLATVPTVAEPSHQWEMIKYEDISWKKRVWRKIDLSTDNDLLRDATLKTSLAEILYSGATKNIYKVYTDERFTLFVQNDVQALGSNYDMSSVTSYMIKEDWIMTKVDSKMQVRIIAMAPIFNINGKAETPFWFYYPDLRKYLYDHKISDKAVSDLEELFEGRFFSSKIEKESGGLLEHKHDGPKWK
jgi:hypothetical protein